MSSTTRAIVILLICLSLTSPRAASASPSSNEGSSVNCSSLLSECVALPSERRTACFQSASRDERCRSTELAKVSFLRGTLSPQQSGDEFALLGPQFVEPGCVERFDNQLSSELIRGGVSDDSAKALFSRLQSCRMKTGDDVFRPQ